GNSGRTFPPPEARPPITPQSLDSIKKVRDLGPSRVRTGHDATAKGSTPSQVDEPTPEPEIVPPTASAPPAPIEKHPAVTTPAAATPPIQPTQPTSPPAVTPTVTHAEPPRPARS